MALSVTHTTVVVTPDDGSSEVGTNEWNAAHTISGTLPAANLEAAGSDTQVQFNDGGAFGADANLTYDKTVDTLNIATKLVVTGGTVTASAPVLSATQTWNEGSTVFNAVLVNVTSTASDATSSVLDLQVGGGSIASFARDGRLFVASSNTRPFITSTGGGGDDGWYHNGSLGGYIVNGTPKVTFGTGGDTITIASDQNFGFASGTNSESDSIDTALVRDGAANTLALRRSTNAQTLRIYGTFTDTSNYERLNIYTVAGSRSVIAPTEAGTGVQHHLYLGSDAGGVTNMAQLQLRSDGTISFAKEGIGNRWSITINGHFTAGTDNTYDIGATVATRPRHLFLAGKLHTQKAAELTIASGVITITGSHHDVDTESDGASDDLDTINGGVDGAFLVLRANNDGRTVVCKDGTGNLQLAGGDFSLDNTQDTILLFYSGALSAWLEISRSDNAA